MKNVACFFTGGYTESNSMCKFLNKINGSIHLKQFCPNRTKRRKVKRGSGNVTECDLIDEVCGLTGQSLIQYVSDYLDAHKDEFLEFDALIIEDDLDGRSFEVDAKGNKYSIKNDEFVQYCNQVKSNILRKLDKGDDFPIIFIYAAPEVETWLLSDWDNTFGYVYGPKVLNCLTTEENTYFSARFHPYVNENVLKEYKDRIENYGYFENTYYKLSDQLISSLDSFKAFVGNEAEDAPQSIAQNKELRYSKRLHGDAMLRYISPEKIKAKCPSYFAEAYDIIKSL